MIYRPIRCIQTGYAQGDYRFVLELAGDHPLIAVGLNPSTANEEHPDPTVRKMIGFAERAGYDGLVILNLSSERATDKQRLAGCLDEKMHQRALQNEQEVVVRYPDADIWAAWGDGVGVRPYLRGCVRDIWGILQNNRGNRLQIGALTAKGNPRHPLYVSFRCSFEPFDVEAYLKK